VKGGRNQYELLQDNLNNMSLRREDQILNKDSSKIMSNEISNSRSYTSCENTGAKRNISKYSQKFSKFSSQKLNPIVNTNRFTGNVAREPTFYGTTRTYNKGKTHSMY
jgi:hypothetical protein